MYLKSLELQGFKSFPDKTTIRFSDGMTAIVGPNGSGKSNISDAIRWVLGEQSTKSLRGAKMEDVVFGGTARRGAMGAAQVTLILDNSAGQFPVEAAEVMVTRKYFRSGESEYYLNRKRVRLRDIRDVFMDTGLGHDGYSIIGQGRIDEILATKSTDRREVFEEAAGVTRFRTRKEEAERKLDQTAENLVRIRDIWNELDARSGPLEKQAQSAKKYMELRDALRLHEISLWLDTLDGMQDAKKSSDAARIEAEQKLEAVREQQKQQYARSEQLSEQMRQSDIRTEQLQVQLAREEEQAGELSTAHVISDMPFALMQRFQLRLYGTNIRLHGKQLFSNCICMQPQFFCFLLSAVHALCQLLYFRLFLRICSVFAVYLLLQIGQSLLTRLQLHKQRTALLLLRRRAWRCTPPAMRIKSSNLS